VNEIWNRLLSDTSDDAKLHQQLAESMSQTISEKLKQLATRKEESRKKVFRI
jgi:hypothetical protein